MTQFEFTVVLDRVPKNDEYDLLFEVGLDDTTPETRDGRCVLNVNRKAQSLDAAIASVVKDVQQAGFKAVGIEEEDLVSLRTIAQRMGRTYESVRLLASGKRGPGGFPAPLSGDGWALYSWVKVSEWFHANYGVEPSTTNDERVLAATDHLLRARELVGSEEILILVTLLAIEAVKKEKKQGKDRKKFLV